MKERQLDLLMDVAPDGVSRDGLRIEPADRGYRVTAGDLDHRVDSDQGLRRLLRDELPSYVSNWYFWRSVRQNVSEDGRTFLRWLEKADERSVPWRYEQLESGSFDRSWGQIMITLRLNERGERRYDLRHRADRGALLDELDLHVDPGEARDLSKYTDDGEYRPIKGAPDLRSGWVYSGLAPEKLLKTVDFFYPASVANWFRHREERLDVTHFREAAERHTGIYSVIEHLAPDALNALVRDCCTDSNCIKNRIWDETATRPIDVPRGDGSIPCREPCPLFVDEARGGVQESGSTSSNETS